MLSATPRRFATGTLSSQAGRPAHVSATDDSAETTFAYRGDGLRESRTFDSNTVTFTWDIAAGLPVVIDDYPCVF